MRGIEGSQNPESEMATFQSKAEGFYFYEQREANFMHFFFKLFLYNSLVLSLRFFSLKNVIMQRHCSSEKTAVFHFKVPGKSVVAHETEF